MRLEPPRRFLEHTSINGDLGSGYVITDGQISDWNPAEAGSGTVQGLIAALEAGRASIVVHTNDLNPATPQGRAGDSPAGEIRGTLQ